MRILSGEEEKEARYYMEEAAKMAANSPCFKSHCGSVVVKNRRIIGRGYNSPPRGGKITSCIKDCIPKDFESDRHCCLHAEQRAIMDVFRNWPEKIYEARLYFIRLNANNEKMFAGRPYCTICSKMALDSGISEFGLWHEEGICVYGTEEYNKFSFGLIDWGEEMKKLAEQVRKNL
jgi:deoxycytidylate deaminase